MALGFLERADDRYANTPETDLFLDRKKPSYVGGILEMANHRLYPFWGHLTEALRTGQPQNEVKSGGPGLFETLYADPARLKEFLAAMTGISHGANMTIARHVPLEGPPHLRRRRHGAGRSRRADRPGQPAPAGRRLRPARGGADLRGVRRKPSASADRLALRAGRLLRARPAEGRRGGDGAHPARLGSAHQEDADRRRRIDALPAGGALIVYEAIIDDDRSKNAFGLMMSLNMLIETPGGFDYTGADCAGWMKEAGFSSTRVEPLVGPDSMVIGIK